MVSLGFAVVVPNFAAEAGVHGPNIVGGGEVEDAVHFERSGFEFLVGGINPCEGKSVDVGGADLVERAEPSSGIITVIGGPGVGGGFLKGRWIQALRGANRRGQVENKKQQDRDSCFWA